MMIYILGESHSPAFNLALEEYCFRRLTQYDKIFLLWRNEPSIIVGKHQNTLEEINTQYVREKGIHVVRRISGGGTVYHDLNNLNYTIISNEEKGIGFDLKDFTKPIISTLKKLGVTAELSPRNDLRIDGKKICGTAQAFVKGRMMFHGCLLFNADLSALSKGLKEPKEIIKSKGVKSVRSEVDNILPHLREPLQVEQFADKILETIKEEYPEIKPFDFSPEEIALFKKTATEKYSDWEWNYAHSPAFTIEKRTLTSMGELKVHATISEGRIREISVWTAEENLSSLADNFIGVKYCQEALEEKLQQTPSSFLIPGLTMQEIARAIVR
ncbi:MAG: lipoate--protein ligase [Dysgonamonadaceae bacterium]